MIPGFCLTRLNLRYNLMTCKKPCDNCTCAPCGHLDYDDDIYIEADASPMATQQRKWLDSASSYFDRACSLNPSAPECRVYED